MATHPIKSLKSDRKYDHKDYVRDTVNDQYLTRLRATDVSMPYDDLVGIVWTEAERAQVKATLAMISTSSLDRSNDFRATVPVVVKHEALPGPVDMDITLYTSLPKDGQPYVWPIEWERGVVNGAIMREGRVIDIAHNIVYAGINRGLLQQVTNWLLENCDTHEQAAWLLPGWAPLLRRCHGTKGIGMEIADLQRPRSLPPVPQWMRTRLRWAHLFLATHELLGTFDNRASEPDRKQCVFRLAGNHSLKLQEVEGEGDFTVPVTIV